MTCSYKTGVLVLSFSGTGLKSGIVDNRSKFTVLVSDTIGVFNLLVEVRGPNHEYCGERVVSLHQAKSIMDMSSEGQDPQSQGTKFLEDCAGNTFNESVQ